MSEPSRRARDIGNAVVRRTTGLVAASCLVGTGAFVAIQARTHSADSSGGGTPAAGPQPTDPLLVTAGSSTAPADSGACVDDHDADHDEHDDHESGDNDEHESDDHETGHEEHESNGDHASDDHDSNEGGRADCASAFTPPAAAPAAAPPQTTPRVVSGGS